MKIKDSISQNINLFYILFFFIIGIKTFLKIILNNFGIVLFNKSNDDIITIINSLVISAIIIIIIHFYREKSQKTSIVNSKS